MGLLIGTSVMETCRERWSFLQFYYLQSNFLILLFLSPLSFSLSLSSFSLDPLSRPSLSPLSLAPLSNPISLSNLLSLSLSLSRTHTSKYTSLSRTHTLFLWANSFETVAHQRVLVFEYETERLNGFGKALVIHVNFRTQYCDKKLQVAIVIREGYDLGKSLEYQKRG